VTAPWVRSLAIALEKDRRAVLELARAAAGDFWDRPSTVEGWTNKHVLAHLAGGNDQLVQQLLRAVVHGEALDPGLQSVDTDAENAKRIEERLGWTVDQLIAELERDGAEVQDLLSRLSEEQRHVRQPGFALTVGQFLKIVERERHDLLHIAQFRA
jgi:uncharacterized protein (TIGR03083 family)